MDWNGLPQRLEKAMQDKGLRQARLARLAKVDSSYISRLLKGKVQKPDPDRVEHSALARIAHHVDRSLDELLGLDGHAVPLGPRSLRKAKPASHPLADEWRRVALREIEVVLVEKYQDIWGPFAQFRDKDLLLKQLIGHLRAWADLIREEGQMQARGVE